MGLYSFPMPHLADTPLPRCRRSLWTTPMTKHVIKERCWPILQTKENIQQECHAKCILLREEHKTSRFNSHEFRSTRLNVPMETVTQSTPQLVSMATTGPVPSSFPISSLNFWISSLMTFSWALSCCIWRRTLVFASSIAVTLRCFLSSTEHQ